MRDWHVDAEPRQRFRLTAFCDIHLQTTRSYLVKGLIPREGLIVVWGPPKCGKTFWVYDLVLHVALGWDYRGRRVTTGKVVYIACEGERGLAARTEAFRLEKMGHDAEAPNFHLLTTRLGLASEHQVLIADIQEQLGDGGCDVIVIDTLNRSIEGSENDDADMGAYVKAADAIREAFNCAVIIIHHCGVNGDRPRGHSALTGAADAQIAVKRDAAGQIVATVEWMKDGPEGDEIVSALRPVEVGTDEDGEPITSCVIDAAESSGIRSPEKKKKITPAAGQALKLLNECVATAATETPASDHVPVGAKGVTKRLWQGYLEKGGIINADGNPREQIRRIIVTLKDAGLIGVWDDFVWPVTARHKASQ